MSREVWLAAGKAGLLGIDMDEEYGGGGNADYRYYLITNEELARAGSSLRRHDDWLPSISSALSTPSAPKDFSTYELPSLW